MSQEIRLFPEQASTTAGEVDALYAFLIATSAVFTVGIFGVVVFFTIRYRRKRVGNNAVQIEGSLPLELLWSIVPLGLTMVMFLWGAKLFFEVSRPPANAMDIYVTGKQWMWKMQHPGGQREINDLHVPVGTPVRLTMISEDVVHSFFVPAFRMKRDVLPGRYSTGWFEATQPGEYHLLCAEYCGTKHSQMIGTVYAMEPEDYQRWLSGTAGGETAVELGAQLFENLRCASCHHGGEGARGPMLHGRFGEDTVLDDGTRLPIDAAYVRESILRPRTHQVAGYGAIMPTYEGQLSEEQVLHLVAYLRSLAAPGEEAR